MESEFFLERFGNGRTQEEEEKEQEEEEEEVEDLAQGRGMLTSSFDFFPESNTLTVLPEDDNDADQKAEEEMMRQGLTASTFGLEVFRSSFSPPERKGSVYFASREDLLLDEPANEEEEEAKFLQREVSTSKLSSEKVVHAPSTPASESKEKEDQNRKDFAFLRRRLVSQFGLQQRPLEEDPLCRRLRTVLMLPFYYSPDVERESPASVASALLSRVVRVDGGPRCALWEHAAMPDVSELSRHFRQLLGDDDASLSLVQRLRMTDQAREWMFQNARLWADCKTGDYAGKRCDWYNVHLVIFPHGAIFSVTLDWLSQDVDADSMFTLSDLRSWLYVAKFRAIKVGVTRGWSFERRLCPNDLVSSEQDALGLDLFAALYGGSCISMVTIANWLVKLPNESALAVPRRVSRFEYSMHYTYCLIDERPSEDALERHLHAVARAQGVKQAILESDGNSRESGQADNQSDEVIYVRHNAAVGLSREGVFGLVWDAEREGSFFEHFLGLYLALALHALAERVTLEKLSYLEALYSQHLPDVEFNSERKTIPREHLELARASVVSLASMLVRYSSCMASNECGGCPEHGEFLSVLRRLYSLPELKKELAEEIQDMLDIVSREWDDARHRSKKKERLWDLRYDEISRQISRTRDSAKQMSDVVSNSLLGVTFPITLAINLFSMNLDTLPREFPWSWVLIIGGAFSGVMVLVFLAVFFYYRRKLAAVKAEKVELLKERSERLRLAAGSLDDDEEAIRPEPEQMSDPFRIGGIGSYLGALRRLEATESSMDTISLHQERFSMDILRKPGSVGNGNNKRGSFRMRGKKGV